MLMKNPIIKRYSFSLFRRGSVIVSAIIYTTVIMIINALSFLYVVANMQKGANLDIAKLATTIYPWMLGLSVLVFWIIASITPVSILFSQIIKGSQDFFEILPISGRKKAAGLMIGTNLIYYPLSIISIILTTQYGILGGLSVSFQLNTIFLFIAGGLFFNTLSILVGVSSMKITKKQKVNGGNPAAAVVFVVIFLFPMIGIIHDIGKKITDIDSITLNFYGIELPAMFSAGCIAIYFAAWNFIGAARKFTDKTVPFFTRPGALLYFMSIQFLLLGFLFNHLNDDELNISIFSGIFGVVTFFIMLIISMASLRVKRHIIHTIDYIAITIRERNSSLILKIINASNLPVFAMLFLLWSAPVLILILRSGYDITPLFIHFATFALFTLFAASASELYIMLQESQWKYHTLLLISVCIYQLGICTGGILLRSSQLLIFSLPGYVYSIFDNSPFSSKITLLDRVQALGFNLLIALALFASIIYIYYTTWKQRDDAYAIQKIADDTRENQSGRENEQT